MTDTTYIAHFDESPSVLPMDSAFTHRQVCKAELSHEEHQEDEDFVQSLATNGTIVLCAISFLLCIKKIRNILPSLIGCILRWKESVNLEFSMKLKRDRNILATVAVIPFCLICSQYRIYNPDFMSDMGDAIRLAVTIGAFILMLTVRHLAEWCFKGWKCDKETYNIGICSSRTFFIITTSAALIAAGITAASGMDKSLAAIVISITILCFYLISLLRKIQIFANSCNLFQAILYLCGLEILPTSLVIASALVL
ncbi:MAG: DUF4271 domain-containing protein [Candidatus Cryptobacteroides sp.]